MTARPWVASGIRRAGGTGGIRRAGRAGMRPLGGRYGAKYGLRASAAYAWRPAGVNRQSASGPCASK